MSSRATPLGGAPGRAAWCGLALLVVAGGAARLASHDRSSLWFDEIITLEEASRGSLLETVRAKAIHPPLIRVTARLSVLAFGDPARPGGCDLAVRLPSIVMGTAAIVLVFLFAHALSDRDDVVACVAAAAWALLPYGLWYSREARFYAALVLASAWTLYALLRFERAPTSRWAHVHLTAALTFGAYTHYLFALPFALSAIYLLPSVVKEGLPRGWIRLLPWLAAGLLFAPWLAWALPRMDAQPRAWVAPLAQQIRDVPIAFFTGRLGYHHLAGGGAIGTTAVRSMVPLAASLLLLSGSAIHVARRAASGARLTLVVVVPSIIGVAALHHGLAQAPFFHPKYLAFLYPFACVALGELAACVNAARIPMRAARGWRAWIGNAPRRPAAAGAGLLAALVLVPAMTAVGASSGAALTQAYALTFGWSGERQPYGRAAAWIAERRRPTEVVIVLDCWRGYNRYAMRYYGVADPIGHVGCGRAQSITTPPAPGGGRTFAVLTHWGGERRLRAAVTTLRARCGPIVERVRFAGIEGDVLVLSLSTG